MIAKISVTNGVEVSRAPIPDAKCVLCGCTDSKGCPGGCSWYIVDRHSKTGVCSSCYRDEFVAHILARRRPDMTYYARGCGQIASCIAGAQFAVKNCAEKIFPNAHGKIFYFRLSDSLWLTLNGQIKPVWKAAASLKPKAVRA